MRSFEEILPLLNRFGAAMAKYARVDSHASDFGVGVALYPSEIHMVSRVDRHDGVGVTDLAEEFGVTKGAVSQVVTRLVDKGLLVKEPDPLNRTRVVIRTTETGHVASENHLKFHREHDKVFLDYLAGLDDADFARVEEIGAQLNRWMDAYL
ncbi:MarR family winged helix-turn-helix transcriptional regulator [Desulfovibrio sp. Huiquan2017]|uniref:MarR family winged helix-turn-helix transcriptional regulator n=1 Tax=Desulfovibrio sp. Huiquan2017 TaxID=2816861 RepID=UPI001A914141|nr:MarR family winged helix-turn-helix transcriptional regulator [Desulfovibrio sp. Huiquan2017]